MPNPLVYRLTRRVLNAPITEDALNDRLALNATARRKAFSKKVTQTGAVEAKMPNGCRKISGKPNVTATL
jgi:hypothetical protein